MKVEDSLALDEDAPTEVIVAHLKAIDDYLGNDTLEQPGELALPLVQVSDDSAHWSERMEGSNRCN